MLQCDERKNDLDSGNIKNPKFKKKNKKKKLGFLINPSFIKFFFKLQVFSKVDRVLPF